MSDLEQKALGASSVIPPTELHGMVCGFAAGQPAQFSLSDFVQLAGTDSLSDEQAVSDFVSATLDELYGADMTFAPLIPDDDELLATRLTGLSEWCAGFLSGFGAAFGGMAENSAGVDALHVDVQEILRDFASISAIDDDVEGDDQDEGSFMEIFEYVRVAAVLTMTLMAGDDDHGDEI